MNKLPITEDIDTAAVSSDIQTAVSPIYHIIDVIAAEAVVFFRMGKLLTQAVFYDENTIAFSAVKHGAIGFLYHAIYTSGQGLLTEELHIRGETANDPIFGCYENLTIAQLQEGAYFNRLIAITAVVRQRESFGLSADAIHPGIVAAQPEIATFVNVGRVNDITYAFEIRNEPILFFRIHGKTASIRVDIYVSCCIF